MSAQPEYFFRFPLVLAGARPNTRYAPRFEVGYAVYSALAVRDDLCKQECPCAHGDLCALCLCERSVDDVAGSIGAGWGRAEELLLERGGVWVAGRVASCERGGGERCAR